MTRHEYRLKLIFAIYQSLLLKKDLNVLINDSIPEVDQNDFVIKIKEDLLNHMNEYIEDISSHLVKWTFDRLSFIDQAILLDSYAEYKTGLNNKNIIIDEAVRIAKEYSDDESYKYINGVLDKL